MKVVNHHAGCCGYLPVRPDGTEWAHVLGLPAGGSVHADTAAEILGELIPGYDALPDADARRTARESHAADAVTRHQELRIAQALAAGRVREDDPDDAALVAVLRSVRASPIRLELAGGEEATTARTAEGQDLGPRWSAPIRLVCLTTAYAPYGEAPAPLGDVDWIDPTDEEEYLLSLRRAGALDYWCERV